MADRPPRRFRWLVLRLAVAGLGVIVLIAVGLWLALPIIAERVITDRLVAMGVPEPRLSLGDIGPTGATAFDVSLGTAGELTADRIVVTYRLPELLDGVIDGIALDGATVHASIGPDGLSLGSLDVLLAGGGGGELPTLPPITLEEARVDLDTAFGAVALTGGGTVTSIEGGLAADLDLAANAPQGRTRGKLHVEIAGAEIDARLSLRETRIELPELLGATATGEASARLSHGEITALDADLAVSELSFSDPRAAALGALSGTLSVTRGPDAWRAAAALHDSADSLGLALRVSTPGLDLAEVATIAADIDSTAASPLWFLFGVLPPSGGRLSLGLVSEISPATLIAAMSEGRLPDLGASMMLDVDGVSYGGTVRSVSATAGFDVESRADTLRLTAAAPILVEGTLDPALLDAAGLPPKMAALLSQPLSATVGLDGPLQIERPAAGSFMTGGIVAAVDLADGHRLLDARGLMRFATAPAAPLSLSLLDIDARLDLPPATELPEGAITLTGQVDTVGGQVAAPMTLAVAMPSVQLNGLRVTDLKLGLPLALGYGKGQMVARIIGKGSASATRLIGTAPLSLDGPVQLPFIASDVPVLVMNLADPESPRATIDMTTGPLRLAGSVEAERGAIAGELAMPRLTLHADLDEAGWSGKLSANGGKLDIPAYAVEATGIDLAIDRPAGAAPRIALAGAVAHRGEPAYVIPLTARIDAHEVRNGWAFSGTAKDAFGRISLAIDGRHNLAKGTGSATLSLAPIEFIPGARQPADLAPWLDGMATEVAGTVALAGDVSWTPDAVTSKLELLVRDLSATTGAGLVERVNGVIAIDGLAPFTTPPGQQVAVALIDAGLPLTDGLLTFRIAPGPVVEIAGGRLHLAGGTVDLEPQTYDPRAPRTEAALLVTGVELGEMLALAGVDGLTGEGRMSGRIPVVVADGDVIITHGELEAEAPGRLSYAPLSPPAALQGQGESVSLALSALTNFQYEALRLTVDRQAGGEMTVAMHIRGKNPDFYDGYPVEFNLNVSGALDRVLRHGLAGYRIPQAIEERLQEFTQ